MAIAEDFLSLLPLFPEETETTIRLRWNGWANEGLTVDDADEWVDTREGNHFFISSQPGVREAAKTYDVMGTDYVAATFPAFAWGTYLDDHALTYSLERLAATHASGEVTFTGEDGTLVPAGTVVAAESPVEGASVKAYEVSEGGTIAGGTVTLPVTAIESGKATDAAVGEVTIVLSTIESEEEVTVANADPIIGGSDPETDEALRERLLEVFEGQGPGNVHDYVVWARAFSASIGLVTVFPVWNGPGTVKVVIRTADGQPNSAELVTDLKAFLDPVAGKGSGQAPVGHTVTVETAVTVKAKVKVKIEFNDGYSLEGTGGTVALKPFIDEALADYMSHVPPGDEVVRQKIIARIASFEGVHDVGAVEINAAAANLVLDDDPAQVAEYRPTESTITEGAV